MKLEFLTDSLYSAKAVRDVLCGHTSAKARLAYINSMSPKHRRQFVRHVLRLCAFTEVTAREVGSAEVTIPQAKQ